MVILNAELLREQAELAGFASHTLARRLVNRCSRSCDQNERPADSRTYPKSRRVVCLNTMSVFFLFLVGHRKPHTNWTFLNRPGRGLHALRSHGSALSPSATFTGGGLVEFGEWFPKIKFSKFREREREKERKQHERNLKMFFTKITLTRKIFFAVFMLSAFRLILFSVIRLLATPERSAGSRRRVSDFFFEFASWGKNFFSASKALSMHFFFESSFENCFRS